MTLETGRNQLKFPSFPSFSPKAGKAGKAKKLDGSGLSSLHSFDFLEGSFYAMIFKILSWKVFFKIDVG